MEKVLRICDVQKYGLDKLESITRDKLEGYTRIGVDAFSGNQNLVYIDIPESVTTIDQDAFRGCSHLVFVNLPRHNHLTIGSGAFRDCRMLTRVEFPEHIENAGYGVFQGTALLRVNHGKLCEGGIIFHAAVATDVKLARGRVVTEGLFANNQAIRSLYIPNTIERIGDYAFSRCSNLTTVKIQRRHTNKPLKLGAFAFHKAGGIYPINVEFVD